MEGLYRSVLVVAIGTLMIEQAVAAQHVVGGSQGWDESTDFESWASAQTFKVGDQLGMYHLHFSSSLFPTPSLFIRLIE